jgi:hypothetical protein
VRGLPDVVDVKTVLVVHGEATAEELERLAESTACLVLAVPEGTTIESLDEDEMRAAGWVRA